VEILGRFNGRNGALTCQWSSRSPPCLAGGADQDFDVPKGLVLAALDPIPTSPGRRIEAAYPWHEN
jgi:hypothetical protein